MPAASENETAANGCMWVHRRQRFARASGMIFERLRLAKPRASTQLKVGGDDLAVASAAETLVTDRHIAEPELPEPEGDHSFGEYEVLSLLGHGGMGDVYKARHKGLDKVFAIKVVHSDLLVDAFALSRFEQEAKAASDLTHVNLVAVYEQGKSDKGAPYIVMDFIDGISLEQIIKTEGFLDVPRALDLSAQLCEALVHAHYKGIVHRDLKPSNILITKNDAGAEIVKVVDFGIAKILERTAGDGNVTGTGEVFGSPSYMSPEQCLGLPITKQSDIYSLGCVMYEMLTGTSPFVGETPMHTMMKSMSEAPLALSKRYRDLNIPPEAESLIFKCLEKETANRYESVDSLLTDLMQIKDELPQILKRRPKKRFGSAVDIALGAIILGALFLNMTIKPFTSEPQKVERTKAPIIPINVNTAVSVPAFRVTVKNPTKPITEVNYRQSAPAYYNFAAPVDVHRLFQNLSMIHAELANSDFSGWQMDNVVIANLNFENADFSNCTLTRVTFKDCTMRGANFRDTKFGSCNFTNSDLADCDFQNTLFGIASTGTSKPSNFISGCDFSNANFSGATIVNTFFEGIFKSCKFDQSKLFNVSFKNSDLREASLTKSSMHGVNVIDSRANSDLNEWLSAQGPLLSDPRVDSPRLSH